MKLVAEFLYKLKLELAPLGRTPLPTRLVPHAWSIKLILGERTVVTTREDNAANVDAAAKKLQITKPECLLHILNLAA